MPAITMKELLEAGVHFGHQTQRWNPKMKRYIYGARNGIYIIDLHQTLKLFEDARNFIQESWPSGEVVLFVGTKKQAQEAVESSAKRCGMYFVNQRWLGGMLTNYRTIQTRIGGSASWRRWKPTAFSSNSRRKKPPSCARNARSSSVPRRYQGHAEAARRDLHRRPQEGAHRRSWRPASWRSRS